MKDVSPSSKEMLVAVPKEVTPASPKIGGNGSDPRAVAVI